MQEADGPDRDHDGRQPIRYPILDRSIIEPHLRLHHPRLLFPCRVKPPVVEITGHRERSIVRALPLHHSSSSSS